MTLNIVFFTVTIQKRQVSAMEILHEERVNQLMEDNKVNIIKLGGFRHI